MKTWSILVGAAAIALVAVSPAAAKVCKDELSATSSSRIAGSEDARDARGKDNAIKKWAKQVQATQGFAYRYWFRADDRKTECTRTKSTSRCTATAKPCRIL
jgi:hypothetical protein